MKKSEMFKAAQLAVLSAPFIADADKLEIVKVLMGEESIQKLVEEREGKDNE